MKGPFRRVLIPIDGSAPAMEAAELGIRLAKSQGLEIVALHVLDETVLDSLRQLLGKGEEELRREGEKYLHHLAKAAEREGVGFEGFIEVGLPHRVIVDVAEREGVDLILMGKVGQRGPRRILIGSVTERVLAAAECPVLVVPSRKI